MPRKRLRVRVPPWAQNIYLNSTGIQIVLLSCTDMALYTGKGDAGTTKVFDSKPGERISKSSERAEALGSLDELNSFLGLCTVHAARMQDGGGGVKVGRNTERTAEILRRAQKDLFIVQAEVAGADKKITRAKVVRVEKIIQAIEEQIPPITSFTIAGGTEVAALLDVARTIVRRTERRVVAVHEAKIRRMSKHSLAYLNRLSSLMFALARFTNVRAGIKEESPDYL